MAVKKDLNQLKTQLASKTPTATALNDTTSGYTAPSYSSQPSTAKPTTKTNLPTLNATKPQFDGLDYGVNRVPAVDEDYLKYLKQTVSGNKYGTWKTFGDPKFTPIDPTRPIGTLSDDDIINIEAQAARDNYRAYLNNTKSTANDRRNEVTAQATGLNAPSLGLGTIKPSLPVDLRDSNYLTNAALESAYTNDGKELAKTIAAQQAEADKYLLKSIAGDVPTKETVAEANKRYNNGTSPQDTQNRLLAMAAAKYADDHGIKFSEDDTAAILNGDYFPLFKTTQGENNPLGNFPAGKATDAYNIADALMNAYYGTNGYPAAAGSAVSPAITYNNDYRVTAPKTQTNKFALDFGKSSGGVTPYDPKTAAALAEALSQTTKPDSGKGDDGKGGDKGDDGGSGDNGGSGTGGTGGGGTGVGGYGISGDIGQYLLNFSDKYYKESQKYLDEVMETMKKEGKNQQNQLEKTLGETLFDLQKQRAANNAAAFTTNANVGALTAGNVQADQASSRELSKSADTYYNNLQTLLYQLQSSKNNWSTNRWGWIYDALGDYMYGAMGSQAAAQIGLQQALAEIAASKSLQAEQNKWIESHPEFYSTQS